MLLQKIRVEVISVALEKGGAIIVIFSFPIKYYFTRTQKNTIGLHGNGIRAALYVL